MDGIVTGLTSVIPVVPENNAINAKIGGPSVEIIPLPQDSFQSEDVTAELRGNPYTLNLDSDGRNGGAAAGSTPGGMHNPSLLDELSSGEQAGGAFTLSLGTNEEPLIPANVAYEMERAKSYEALGKIAGRRATRPARGQPPPYPDAAAEDGEAAQSDAHTVRYAGTVIWQPAIAELINAGTGVLDGITDAVPPEAGEIPAGPETRRAEEPAPVGLADRLTSSDYEALMELTPELRTVFMRMLSTEAAAETGNNEAAASHLSAAEPESYTLPAERPVQNAAVRERVILPDAAQRIRQPTDAPRSITAPDGELPSLAAGIIRASAPDLPIQAGSMANLRRITELPYALYLFGPPDERVRRDGGGEDDEPASERSKPASAGASEFLKLSEAIRMASVLHQIYRGGSGRFEEETPWYLPYVRYAVKHGIILSGEFEDIDEYATRAEAAYIFSGSVPAAEFPVLNHVADIPDVSEHMGYGGQICLLLRAGVFTPGGKGGLFYPERLLTRSEAAALIGRIATPSDRRLF